MAIQSARVYLDGTWYPLTYNADAAAWQANVVPVRSSYNQTGGYFPVTIEATNETGTTITVTAAENSWLRLRVLDKIAPVVKMETVYPNNYITTKRPVFVFTVTDDDSGIKSSTISAEMDNGAISGTISTAEITGGYRVTYKAAEDVPEGPHSFSVTVQDNDGNESNFVENYIVDTIPPELFIFSPNLNYIVDVPSVILNGKTVDATSGLSSLVCASTALGEVQVPTDINGVFSMVIPLNVGRNDISVTSTDAAGLSSTSEFFMLRLITDRTQEDVDEIVRIMSTPPANWTEEEWEIYVSAMARGSYDYVDMNRVTEAMDYLDQMLRGNGIESGYSQIKPVWYEEDIVYPSVAESYLANVEALRSSIVLPENTPEVPANMEGFTFQEANDIEKILVFIDSLFYYIDKSFWYSDEIFCGEE